VYGPVADEHLKQPRNLGKLDPCDGVGEVDDQDSETLLTIYLRLGEATVGRVVQEARFRAFGCGGCIITGSVATELATGRPIAEVVNIDASTIHHAIADGLPPEQRYCADLAARALRLAARSASGE
jgi:nitrogen fixation protein NifU and related proteins